MQRLRIHLQGAAWRSAEPDPPVTTPTSAAFFQLLLGPIRRHRPLLEVLANPIRTAALEERPVLEHGEGELSKNVPALEVVEHVLRLERRRRRNSVQSASFS